MSARFRKTEASTRRLDGYLLGSTPRLELAKSGAMTTDDVKQRIEAGIPNAIAQVQDLTGTGDHFQAQVVAPAFAGKTRVEQHQMVYAALGELMTGPIHALKLQTRVE